MFRFENEVSAIFITDEAIRTQRKAIRQNALGDRHESMRQRQESKEFDPVEAWRVWKCANRAFASAELSWPS
jgi:hypothetical protein